MGNKAFESNQQSNFHRSKSISASAEALQDNETKLMEIDDYTDVGRLQQMWRKDSSVMLAACNGNRLLFMNMAKLCRALQIQSIDNTQKKRKLTLKVHAALTFDNDSFTLIFGKSCQTDLDDDDTQQDKDTISIDGAEWTPSVKFQTNDNEELEAKYVAMFKQYLLEFISSKNVEQFRAAL